MGRRVLAAIVTVLVAPFFVGLAVNLGGPWLVTNLGSLGQALTSTWLAWAVYGIWAAGWLYYFFVVATAREAPAARIRAINALFDEIEAIRAAVLPMTQPDAPAALTKRVERLRKQVSKQLESDVAYRAWLANSQHYDVIRRSVSNPANPSWRGAIFYLLNAADPTLQEFVSRVATQAIQQSPGSSRRDR
jgi:hypothetical protein